MNGVSEQGAVPGRSRIQRGAPRLRARGQRGVISVRLLLALVVSSTVTAAVSVPMAYQAHQANGSGAELTPAVPSPTTAVGDESDRTPDGGAEDTIPENPGIALPPLTTETPDSVSPATAGRPTTTATSAPTGPRAPARPTPTVPPPAVLPGTTIRGEPPTTTPATTTTLAPRVSDEGLAWADEPGLEDLRPLGGARIEGLIWVYFDGPATTVTFWLDDPDGIGPPRAVERQPPFDLLGGPDNANPDPLDTSSLADGTHTVRALVETDGGRSIRLATFTVANG